MSDFCILLILICKLSSLIIKFKLLKKKISLKILNRIFSNILYLYKLQQCFALLKLNLKKN